MDQLEFSRYIWLPLDDLGSQFLRLTSLRLCLCRALVGFDLHKSVSEILRSTLGQVLKHTEVSRSCPVSFQVFKQGFEPHRH